VCLGGGVAGEAIAVGLRDSGLTLAVVERELVGGVCPYWGCVPSKTLLRSSETLTEAGRARVLAASRVEWTVDFPKVSTTAVSRVLPRRMDHLDGSAATCLADPVAAVSAGRSGAGIRGTRMRDVLPCGAVGSTVAVGPGAPSRGCPTAGSGCNGRCHRRRREAEGRAQPVIDSRQVLREQPTQRALDQRLFDRDKVRHARRAGMPESNTPPVSERVIAGPRPLVVARLAADGAHDHVEQRAMERLGAHDHGWPRFHAARAGERHLDDDDLAALISSRRGRPLRLPTPASASAGRGSARPARRDRFLRVAG
jgi:hypothetical protein